ncbi:tyrosine-type recombinase/integrase [Sphingomonas sp. LB-2]|uniref:tyrosine-type recombinase/integrase n=1 Tax=Sphingomonas caeni TaxID=2984949 RepID=UPI0022316D47|nr:tyrosine-type recombinase/integrase [Sphingomonas caeni]MCW3848116.1 tyrosine-type recombinase/integrase [Sphingomonas caeni]
MAKHCAANERVKRQYFEYLREAQRRNTASVDQAAAALSGFEESTGHKDFKTFHRAQAIAFKNRLNKQVSARTGQPLSRATVHSTLSALRSFFIWLADKPGYKSRFGYSEADFFNLPEKDVRIAHARRERPAPTLEQMQHVISVMPASTDLEMRDRALVAFALLTGARDGALVSLKLKHVDLAAGRLDQDARDVNTKFSKTFSTWFLPVGGNALAIVTEWIKYLRVTLLWGDSDPLFPATKIGLGPEGGFTAIGLERANWSTSEPVRRIFRSAFEAAGLPYFNPHTVRTTLARLGQQLCRTPEEYKAWSQNLGHDDVLTTFTSYGSVPGYRQAELIRSISAETPGVSLDERIRRLEQLVPAQAGRPHSLG